MNPNERIIRLPEVLGMVGMKKTAIYDKIKDGTFPAPLKLGRVSGWLESDIQRWISQVAAKGSAVTPNARMAELKITIPDGLHEDTADLVARFAAAMAEKLHAAEKKYGYSNGWKADDWLNECRDKLLEHTEKGDPRDVANYCAFLWHHGQPTDTGRLSYWRTAADEKAWRERAQR